MNCECGHPMRLFLVEGQEVPYEYECPVCEKVTEISEVEMLDQTKKTLEKGGAVKVSFECLMGDHSACKVEIDKHGVDKDSPIKITWCKCSCHFKELVNKPPVDG